MLSDAGHRAPAVAVASWKTRPWLWAVAGIAVASAVWAAVLPTPDSTTPDLHGYHVGGNPCGGAVLDALKDTVGERGFAASDATVSRGPAVDRVSCVLSSESPSGDGWATDYTVAVSVELHKKTDPRAEFENAARARVSTVPGAAQGGSVLTVIAAGADYSSAADVSPARGLGDRAYWIAHQTSHQTLEVLDGGAVLSLQVSGFGRWVGPGTGPAGDGEPPATPDLGRLRPAMTTAMRGLMASLAS